MSVSLLCECVFACVCTKTLFPKAVTVAVCESEIWPKVIKIFKPHPPKMGETTDLFTTLYNGILVVICEGIAASDTLVHLVVPEGT